MHGRDGWDRGPSESARPYLGSTGDKVRCDRLVNRPERQDVKSVSAYQSALAFLSVLCGLEACAMQTQPQGTVTVLLQWFAPASVDTVILDARSVPLHGSLRHEVPPGAMALEGYMLGSAEHATMFGWVNAQGSPRLPVFAEINAVPDLLEALRELPVLPRSRAVPAEDSQDLVLFFLHDIGDSPRREVVARFWAQGGSRMLRVDPNQSMVRAQPLLRLRDRDIPDTGSTRRLRIRLEGSAELSSTIPFLVVRDGNRWTASTLSWNRMERLDFTAGALPSGAPGRLMIYLFAPPTNEK